MKLSYVSAACQEDLKEYNRYKQSSESKNVMLLYAAGING